MSAPPSDNRNKTIIIVVVAIVLVLLILLIMRSRASTVGGMYPSAPASLTPTSPTPTSPGIIQSVSLLVGSQTSNYCWAQVTLNVSQPATLIGVSVTGSNGTTLSYSGPVSLNQGNNTICLNSSFVPGCVGQIGTITSISFQFNGMPTVTINNPTQATGTVPICPPSNTLLPSS